MKKNPRNVDKYKVKYVSKTMCVEGVGIGDVWRKKLDP